MTMPVGVKTKFSAHQTPPQSELSLGEAYGSRSGAASTTRISSDASNPWLKLYSRASLIVHVAPLIIRTPRSVAPLLSGSPVDAASGTTSPCQWRSSSLKNARIANSSSLRKTTRLQPRRSTFAAHSLKGVSNPTNRSPSLGRGGRTILSSDCPTTHGRRSDWGYLGWNSNDNSPSW